MMNKLHVYVAWIKTHYLCLMSTHENIAVCFLAPDYLLCYQAVFQSREPNTCQYRLTSRANRALRLLANGGFQKQGLV